MGRSQWDTGELESKGKGLWKSMKSKLDWNLGIQQAKVGSSEEALAWFKKKKKNNWCDNFHIIELVDKYSYLTTYM